MNDLERAKRMLRENAALSCILCRGELLYTSEKRGIAPMMELLDAGYEMKGFSAADRIVGRAAAMLFVLAGVRSVYAEVMSEGALQTLSAYAMEASYGTLTPYIVNRKGNGPCPMEEAVRDITEPEAAREAIRMTMDRLRTQNGRSDTQSNI